MATATVDVKRGGPGGWGRSGGGRKLRRFSVAALFGAVLLAGACDSQPKATRTIEQPVGSAGQVLIRTANGAVTLRVDSALAGGTAVATVVARGATTGEAEERVQAVVLRSEMEGGRLVIEPIFPTPRSSNEGASIVVTMPSLSGAEVVTSNGVVIVDGVAGDVTVVTSNGRLELSRISGAVTATSSNGRIEAQEIGRTLKLTTSNGAVTTRSVAGAQTVVSSNGRIDAEVAVAPLSITTSNGSLTLALGSGFAGTLELRTSNGKIEAPETLGADQVRIDRKDATLRFGADEPRSTATTSNGRITVRRME